MIREALTRLLEATPPPPAGADIEELICMFEEVAALRQEILDQITTPFELTDAERAIAAQIVLHQDAWREALAAAHADVCAQRAGVGKLRRYASANQAELER